MVSPSVELGECLRVAKKVALSAGKSHFLPSYQKPTEEKSVDIKDGNASNLVTETDRNIQALIYAQLKEAFPTFRFMGEEEDANSIPETGLTEEPTWIVDPIDGTTNFVHCFRFTVISIALAVGKEAVVGVVYNPVTDELFEAVKGKGAWLNGHRLVNRCTLDLQSSLVFTEFGATGRGCNVSRRMDQLQRLTSHGVHGIRMLGSAAYNMCVVANGTGQLYFEEGIHAWDIAAGVVVLAEAGGIVANFGLNDSVCFDLTARSVVAASSQQIYSEFVKLMQ